MRRMRAIAAAILAGTMFLSACGSKAQQPAADSQSGGARDRVIVTLNSEPTSLHAGLATSVVASFVGTQLFDPLVVKNSQGEIVPCLAKSWEYSEEDMAYTFELRDDVTFHNGDKMTAEDVAFSYQTIMDSGYSNVLTSFIENMEVVDDAHVRLNCKMPYGPALECMAQPAMGILSKAAYEENPDAFVRNPVGTGAYKLVEWKSGASITMEANEDYFAGAPAIKNVDFIIYNNAATSAALALENGELDVLTTVASTDYDRLEASDKLQFLATSGSVVDFVMFSMKDGSPFVDENLRLAVAYAIDKEAVLMGALEGKGALANTLVPSYSTGVQGYTAPQYDPEKAKEYLAKAGYPDGIDLTIPCSSSDNYYKPMEIVQAQLAEVGINCTVEKMDNNAWFEDIFRLGNYPFQVVSFSASPADIDYYYEMFVSDGNENFGGVNVPELDEAYKASRSTTDSEKRLAEIRRVVAVMGDKAVIVPICENTKAVAANKDLKGLRADAEGIYRIAEWSWE
ncbi:MAG: ABC transporter substrate-binding protein [Clostridium sp.]|nr:ABC transporter substrate-binding protein [Clostridium sp.]